MLIPWCKTDIPFDKTIRVSIGSEHWELGYPADEWFCDLVRAVGYKETP